MLFRLALICLLLSAAAGIPGFAFGSSLFWDVDRVLFVAFLTGGLGLLVANYLAGAPADSSGQGP